MRALVTLISILSLGGAVSSQTFGDTYWERILERADSVMISRFGTDFFDKHIFTPDKPLDYIVVGEYSYDWNDRDTITTIPTSCYFEYDIGLDPMHVGRMNISFSITPEGVLVEDEDLRGFVSDKPPITFRYDLQGFIRMARQNGVKCKEQDAFRDLRWVPLDTVESIHPNGNGRYELVIGRLRGTGQRKVSNSTFYFRKVDAVVFDPFTGEMLRMEEREESTGVACGVGNL